MVRVGGEKTLPAFFALENVWLREHKKSGGTMKEILKVSVQTGDWYDELFGGDAGADEAFAFIRSCGFDTVDYNIDHTLPGNKINDGTLNDYYDASVEELLERYRPVKEALEKNGVSLGQAHAPFPMYVDGREDVNEYLIKMVEKELAVMQYLGCPALVVHPYSSADKQHEKEVNLAMYRKLMPAAKKYGVKVCLENMFREINGRCVAAACGTAEEACWYLDTLNREAGEDVFGYCFDVGHANLCSRDIHQELLTLGHRLTILHIHDNDGFYDLHQIPYTQKNDWGRRTWTDWEGFVSALKEINYQGTLNFETYAGLKNIPSELIPIMLKLVYEIGSYFRKKITE